MRIDLNGEWMEIEVDSSGLASIKSSLKHDIPSGDEDKYWNVGIDAIESMALAHFVAGIDVFSPAYAEGIRTTLDAMENHLYV